MCKEWRTLYRYQVEMTKYTLKHSIIICTCYFPPLLLQKLPYQPEAHGACLPEMQNRGLKSSHPFSLFKCFISFTALEPTVSMFLCHFTKIKVEHNYNQSEYQKKSTKEKYTKTFTLS